VLGQSLKGSGRIEVAQENRVAAERHSDQRVAGPPIWNVGSTTRLIEVSLIPNMDSPAAFQALDVGIGEHRSLG